MSSGFAKVPESRRRVGVFAALFLATAALAGLSVQSVYREAQVRKQFITDTHRTISELVSARLETAMIDSDHSIAAAMEGIGLPADQLVRTINRIEFAEPWLAPLVLVSAPSSNADQETSASPQFQELIAAAERAEFQRKAPIEASRLYAKAFAGAKTNLERARTLNAQARAELKAGDPTRAIGTYVKVAEQSNTLDREQVRLAVIAKEKLVECYRSIGNEDAAANAAQEFYTFLVDRRFLLDPDCTTFIERKLAFFRRSVNCSWTPLPGNSSPLGCVKRRSWVVPRRWFMFGLHQICERCWIDC
jgi:hypothetical protein